MPIGGPASSVFSNNSKTHLSGSGPETAPISVAPTETFSSSVVTLSPLWNCKIRDHPPLPKPQPNLGAIVQSTDPTTFFGKDAISFYAVHLKPSAPSSRSIDKLKAKIVVFKYDHELTGWAFNSDDIKAVTKVFEEWGYKPQVHEAVEVEDDNA